MDGGPNSHQALTFWHEVTLDLVRDGDVDLNARQLAVLLTVYLETPPHTVRGLAAKLAVTKPVITRGLTALGVLGLVARRRDATDRRSVLVQRTVDGALFLDRLAETIQRRAGALGPGVPGR
jgi:DNA-binding MarR family transcriptional regulator